MRNAVRSFWFGSLGASLAVVLSAVSCGREPVQKKSELDVPMETGPVTSQPKPTSSPNSAPNTGAQVNVVDSSLTPLYNSIVQGAKGQSSDADKTRLVVQEAQRCRQEGAMIVGAGVTASTVPHEELITNYRARHWGPNAFSSCRRSLGLVFSIGSTMKLENLIALENCTRLQETEGLVEQSDRQSQRDLLILENLSLLCGLPNDLLTTEVHHEISSGIVKAWTVRSN